MKIIIDGVLVELILNFDSKLAIAMCSKVVKPSSKFVNYANLMPEQFSISESIIPDLENYNCKTVLDNFSLNDTISRLSQKINLHLDSL